MTEATARATLDDLRFFRMTCEDEIVAAASMEEAKSYWASTTDGEPELCEPVEVTDFLNWEFAEEAMLEAINEGGTFPAQVWTSYPD